MEFFCIFLLIFNVAMLSGALATKLNVLFVVIDDLRPAFNFYGEHCITPNFIRFAKDADVFHCAFAQQSLCAPSRNSLLTSRRPDTIKLYDFYSYWRAVAGNFTTLPQHLKENDYYTYSIGKIFHPGISSNFTDDYPLSWSHPAWHPSTEEYKDSPVCASEDGLHTNLICPVDVKEQPERSLPDIQIADEAVRFIKGRNNASKPFFLAVGFHKPHIPLKYPKEYQALYPLESIQLPDVRSYPTGLPVVAWNPYNDLRWRDDIKRLNVSFPFGPISDVWAKKIKQSYLASVTYIDHQFGRLIEELKRNKLYDKTVVVVLGDHGWSLGEHGEWAKYSNFDISLRVPLFIRAANLTTGKHVKDIVELVDLFPTVVDILKLKPLSTCPLNSSNVTLCSEGVSLLPVLLGESGNKKMAFSQYPRPGVTPRKHPNSDKPRLKDIKIMGYSVRTARYRYTLWLSWSPLTLKLDWSQVKGTELYDHHYDPHENLNLAGSTKLKETEIRLRRHLKRQFNGVA